MSDEQQWRRTTSTAGSCGSGARTGKRRCAHVLFGAEPTGSETLKNLVLPGLGLVAVVDGGDVTASDLASNFFVEPAALGRKRADVDVQLLCEMNPDGPRAAVGPAALSRPSRPSSPAAAEPPPPLARALFALRWGLVRSFVWLLCLVFFSVLFFRFISA